MLYGKDRTNPINHRKHIDTSLSCPRCGASYQFLYLFGHDGEYQKFRCALCLRQFAPGKPLKPKKKPKLLCPVCGRGAHITHTFSDGIRVRCNAYHPNPEKRCGHLYNIPVAFGNVCQTTADFLDIPLYNSYSRNQSALEVIKNLIAD